MTETIKGTGRASRPFRGQKTYNWKRIWHIALEHKRELAVANLIAILATLASVPTPLLLPLLVDEILLNDPGIALEMLKVIIPDDFETEVVFILSILVTTVILRLAALAFNVWQSRQFTIISKDVIYRIRQSLIQKLGRSALAEYEMTGSGAVASRFVTDLDTVDQFIGSTVSRLLVASLTLISTAAVLFWLHWQLALVIMLFNPVVIYFTTMMGRQVKNLKKEQNRAYEVFQSALTETLDGIQQLRTANREQHYLSRLLGKARHVRDYSSAFQWKTDAANRMSFLIFMFGIDLFRAGAMVTVLLSDLSVGQMMAVFGYLWFMMGPVQELLNMQYGYYASRAALKRINGLLKMREEPSWAEAENPFKGKETAAVALENIHFSYGEKPILKGVSLNIRAGEKIALVGASGGGKSTLVKVLLGLYQANSGRIAFNGVPVEMSGLDCVRENVATVLQHPAIFNTTVRENLTLGREASDEQLWHALEVAQLSHTIKDMTEQLDTLVGKDGVKLSGGQRQRLAIARMIIADPKVVILDEATSALDAATEYLVLQGLESFLKKRTTLIIAHRLSAVRRADRAYVFEDGMISEQGGHDELIQRDGLYARLYGALQS